MFLGRSRFPAGTFTTAARRRKIGVSCDVDSAGLLRESVMLCSASSCSGVNLQRTSRERGCLNSVTYNCPNSNFAILTVRKASNQGVGGSNPSGRTFPIKIFRQHRPAGMEQSRSNRRQTTRRFDYPAPRRVGRRRFSGGGPERSGGRAAQPRAIRPGAQFYSIKINDFAQKEIQRTEIRWGA